MALKGTRNLNPGARILLPFGFAGLWGWAWGCLPTGTNPLPLGLACVLFLYAFFGNRKKASYELLPIAACAVFAVAAAPLRSFGWTPDGVLPLWCEALLGFAFLPLFALFVGYLLSKKTCRLWEGFVLLLAFGAVALLLYYFAVPRLLPGAARENAALCRAAGVAVAGLLTTAAAAIWKKDGVLAGLAFGVDLLCAGAAVIAALVLRKTGFSPAASVLAWMLAGFLVMLLLVCLPNSLLEGEGKFKFRSPISGRYRRWLYDAVFVLFLATAALPVYKLGFLAVNLLKISFWQPWYLVYGILLLAALIAAAAIAHKNIIVRSLHVPVKARPEDFAMRALPCIVLVCFLCDLALTLVNARAMALTNGLGLRAALVSAAGGAEQLISLAAALLFFLAYGIACKCAKLHKS
ncbi:MAG: hypothetical protein IK080_03325 [Clostridia bacterium]|nr:hypothetical protein [Clostridia bacterium]